MVNGAVRHMSAAIRILKIPNVPSFLNFLLYLATEPFTAAVKAAALLALGKNGSPVRPKYASACVLSELVAFSR